jgi:hypothetical protein
MNSYLYTECIVHMLIETSPPPAFFSRLDSLIPESHLVDHCNLGLVGILGSSCN